MSDCEFGSDELYFIEEENIGDIEHYGMPRRSGRYPWGSGDDPFQHDKFLPTIDILKAEGLTEKEMAEELNMSTTEFRALKSLVSNERRRAERERAISLKEHGYSNVKIGEIMGKNESSIRSLLDEEIASRKNKSLETSETLKSLVNEKSYIDVGVGSEYALNVTNQMLKTSVQILKEQGYEVLTPKVEQVGTGQKTTLKLLCPPGTTYGDVYKNMDRIKPIGSIESSDLDKTKTKFGIEPPSSVDPSRIYIRYAEENGTDKDGVIELRRNVPDLYLGGAAYAQTRIAVNDTHYLKGMAMYSDNIPEGYDIVFNTNKHVGTPMIDTESKKRDNCVLKPLKDDPDNPFGAAIKKQITYEENGEVKLGKVNIVNEEGDWGNWSKTLASQMLSKQSMQLIKRQLDLSYADKKAEYDEIMSLTNPTLKRTLLESFADDCDASAVDLKAAALPRQCSHVILPVPDLEDNEIFAPRYKNGETVVLIRYPHSGTFEIPELKVNNKHATALKTIGSDAVDAVGINPNVASKLSGADFDGDSVLVIPCNSSNSNVHILTADSLKGLKNFDTNSYGPDAFPGIDYKKMTSDKQKGTEMGKITNLIMDMTLIGATDDELERAVKHSMVVIDAKKHKLNYEQSYIDNNIAELKIKYQGAKNAGASTLITKSSSSIRVLDRKEGDFVTNPETGKKELRYWDPVTGEKLYRNTGATYKKKVVNKKTGEITYVDTERTIESTKMAETKDAYKLSSGFPQEEAYADYANKLKALANQTRLSIDKVGRLERDPNAAKIYKDEVDSLNVKLLEALKNAPRERQAQILANEIVKAKYRDNPDMEADELKKIKGQALSGARITVGAKKQRVEFTDKEWEAIQNNAISDSKLQQLLSNADLDKVKKLATPKNSNTISDAKIAQLRAKLNSGYTLEEVAESMGLSPSTVAKYSKGGDE